MADYKEVKLQEMFIFKFFFRNTGGLSPKTQRNESYQSHFGEWPHVCILLGKLQFYEKVGLRSWIFDYFLVVLLLTYKL